eukprot:TRINITY_DN7523_c2_g1_i3.p2 TRINITY_DN7523_c2_g1~~TRINITY_DN7523_c2_g1_i3.p2  ORF type:complete len:287 (+),score=28.71 TRINITY_DN7523_c2_g1_i3:48-908(+)
MSAFLCTFIHQFRCKPWCKGRCKHACWLCLARLSPVEKSRQIPLLEFAATFVCIVGCCLLSRLRGGRMATKPLTSASASVTRRVVKELLELTLKQPCEGIKVEFSEENVREVFADIEGPVGTPYEGGTFRMKLVMGDDFPSAPPQGFFLTKIFHPNISEAGEICVNVLKKDWKPDLGVKHVLLVVRCLLIEPFAESALNEEAGRLLLEDYDVFFKQARLITQIHAVPNKRPMPLTTRQGSGVNAPPSPAKSSVEPHCGSPVMKKAKGDSKPITAMAGAKKRALKRL